MGLLGIAISILMYAVLYSGVQEIQGTPIGVFDSLNPYGVAPGATAQRTPVAGPDVPVSGAARVAVRAAYSQIGVPYHYAQENPKGSEGGPGAAFDCSGLTAWCWGKAGVALPHNAQMQLNSVPHVSQIQPGDLIGYHFGSEPGDSTHIDHVGIAVGPGMQIDANHTGDVVKVRPIYTSHIVAVGRPGVGRAGS